MKDNAEILKLRVLLCFWKLSPADRSVTGIARTLGKEKYAVSGPFLRWKRTDSFSGKTPAVRS